MADAAGATGPAPGGEAARLLDELWTELAAPSPFRRGRIDVRFDPEV